MTSEARGGRQPAATTGRQPAFAATMRCLACVVLLGLGGAAGAAGQTYHSGQNLQPVFEGWEQNADGSFNMVFGYLNRNYEEARLDRHRARPDRPRGGLAGAGSRSSTSRSSR